MSTERSVVLSVTSEEIGAGDTVKVSVCVFVLVIFVAVSDVWRASFRDTAQSDTVPRLVVVMVMVKACWVTVGPVIATVLYTVAMIGLEIATAPTAEVLAMVVEAEVVTVW